VLCLRRTRRATAPLTRFRYATPREGVPTAPRRYADVRLRPHPAPLYLPLRAPTPPKTPGRRTFLTYAVPCRRTPRRLWRRVATRSHAGSFAGTGAARSRPGRTALYVNWPQTRRLSAPACGLRRPASRTSVGSLARRVRRQGPSPFTPARRPCVSCGETFRLHDRVAPRHRHGEDTVPLPKINTLMLRLRRTGGHTRGSATFHRVMV